MKIREVMSPNQPVLYIPIGPSGSGKSTLYRKLKADNPDLEAFSLDTLRHEFYDPTDYKAAWEASTKDSTFSNRANQRFMEMIDQKKSLFIDNTNLTPKRRKFYLDAAHKRGYKTVAMVLSTPLEELIARQATRGDKNVPEEAVRQQYRSMVGPVADEFDQVIIVK